MSNYAYVLLIQICQSKIHILYRLYVLIDTNEMNLNSNNFLLQLQVQEL